MSESKTQCIPGSGVLPAFLRRRSAQGNLIWQGTQGFRSTGTMRASFLLRSPRLFRSLGRR